MKELTPRQAQLLKQLAKESAKWLKNPEKRKPMLMAADAIKMDVKQAYNIMDKFKDRGLVNAAGYALTKKGLASVEKGC